MSSLPRNPRSGANGYANGYSAGRYAQPDADNGSVRSYGSDRSRDRRPGGYGGFDEQPDYQERPRVARPTSIERRREVRRSGEFSSRSRSRADPARGGNASKQIEGQWLQDLSLALHPWTSGVWKYTCITPSASNCADLLACRGFGLHTERMDIHDH